MTRNIDSYQKYYTDLNFERSGLFEAVKNHYGCNTVIYPGCSIHVTPSFYFQHVVFIDISEIAKKFFQDTQSVLKLVDNNKKYRQSAYIQFLASDYTSRLPIREANYDLLIALYAGGIIQSCKKYLRYGGIIVTNNHQNDAIEALNDPALTLEALIRKKVQKYLVEKSPNEDLRKILKQYSPPTKNMRNSSKGLEYIDNECYFVLKKVRTPNN